MKLEDQFVSLPLAKKMKEAGWPQNESIAVWREFGPYLNLYGFAIDFRRPYNTEQETIAAASVAELGEALKGRLMPEYWDLHQDGKGEWLSHTGWETYKTEADARAVMWLDLREKGLL